MAQGLAAALLLAVGVGSGVALRDRAAPAPKPPRPAAVSPASEAALSPAIRQQFGEAFRRGYAHFRREQFQQAVEEFGAAVRAAPQLAEGHYLLGEAYRGQLLYDNAEAAYRSALSCSPDFRPAEEKLAMLLYERGRHEEALELLDTMQRQAGAAAAAEDWLVLGEQAMNWLALGEPGKARPLLEQYQKLRGRTAWGAAHLGRAHDLAGNPAEAERLYRQAIDLDRHFAEAQLWLGLLLARSQRADESRRALAEHQRLVALRSQEHQLAMALLRAPSDPAMLLRLARARHALGKYADALATLDRALELAPGNRELIALRQEWSRLGDQR